MKFYYPPKNIIIFIFVNTFLMIMMSYVVQLLPFDGNLDNPVADELKEDMGNTGFFFFVVFVVPILETFFFQTLIIHGVRVSLFKITKLKSIYINIIAIALSALAFAFNHNFNFIYAILGGLTGIILAYSCIHAIEIKSKPFLVVASIHALSNAVAWISRSM